MILAVLWLAIVVYLSAFMIQIRLKDIADELKKKN